MKKIILLLLLVLPFSFFGQGHFGFTTGNYVSEQLYGKNTQMAPTSETVENLAVLGKVWGFLKYYHPNVAAGKFDWDQELFYIMPFIKNATSASQRNKELSDWIRLLGDFTKKEQQDQLGKAEVKLYPDLGWIEDVEVLGEELSSLLVDVKNAQRTGKNVYVSLAPNVNNPLFSEVDDSNNTDDVDVRLLSLFRYWNMIQYYFPNRHLIGEDWHEVLLDEIPKFIETTTNLEYRLEVLKLIGRIHDTHANIWSLRDDIDNFLYGGIYYAPVRLASIEGKVVVTGYYKENFGIASGLKNGDVIVGVNGESMDEKIKRLLPYIPASNYTTQLRDLIPNILRSEKADNIHVEFERDGILCTKNVKLYTEGQLGVGIDANENKKSYELLSDCVGYVYPGTIDGDDIPDLMEKFKNTDGIIIDMRCYPKTFIPYSLGKYFMPQATEFTKITEGSIKTPGLFTFLESSLYVGENNPDYYNGKIVIIVNTETQSQAEFTTMAFRMAPNALVIGDTTAGADGNVSGITLPGYIYSYISGIGILNPDGSETQRIGIVPDITVRPTIKGITDGRDELLEKAMELICGVGIGELTTTENNLKLFPNPTKGILYLQYDISGEICIVDIFGRVIKQFSFVPDKKEIDVKGLPAGMYSLIFKPEQKGQTIHQKFIVQH